MKARGTVAGIRGLSQLHAVMYGIGHFGVSVLAFGLTTQMAPLYAAEPKDPATWLFPVVFLGSPALTFFLAAGLPRLTDAVNDPLIGLWSDRTRTRWGRRHPFMAASLIPLLLLFALLYSPPHPDAQTMANLWWWMSLQILLFVAFTGYVAPYLSLLPEYARGPGERARLAAIQGVANLAGLLLGPAVVFLAREQGWSVITALTLAAAPALLLPLLVPAPPSRPAAEAPPGLRESVRLTLTNRPFQMYVGSKFLFLTGMLALLQWLEYLHAEGSPFAVNPSLLQLAAIGAAILSMPLFLALRRRWGMKGAYVASLFTFALPAFFATTTSSLAVLWVAIIACGIGAGGLFSLPYAILADITDLDQVRTGKARQGIFFGVQGLLLKGCYAIAPALVVAVQTVWPEGGQAAIGPVIGLMCIGAALVFRGYPEQGIAAEIHP